MKYFDVLYKNNLQIYELNSPIILHEVAIVKDTVDDEILLRNTMRNISDKRIVAVLLSITLKDIFGNIVYGMSEDGRDDFQYLYQDISFGKQEMFGNKIPIKLPPTARKADVIIEKVVFEDGVIWQSKKDDFVTLQEQKRIIEPEFLIESIPATNGNKCLYYYLENDSCWQCTCGHPNTLNALYCSNCGFERTIVKESLTKEKIGKRYQDYLDLEEQKKKKIEWERGNLYSNGETQNVYGNFASDNSVKNTIYKDVNQKNKKVITIAGIVTAIMVSIVVIIVCAALLKEPDTSSREDRTASEIDAIITESVSLDIEGEVIGNSYRYTVIARNQSEYDLKGFTMEVKLLDEDGNVADERVLEEVDDFDAGTVVKKSFISDVKVNGYSINWDYTSYR